MTSMRITDIMPQTTGRLRLVELADRLLKSCKRKPVDVQRWVRWRAERCDLSIEMLQNAVRAGGSRAYARAILLQLLSDFADDGTDSPPPLDECQRLAIEADLASDRARQMALLDGRITPDEHREMEVTFTHEQSILGLFLARLRRSVRPVPQQVGVRGTW